ncbi:hypothetical protein BGX27_005357, partial [Mortierella sp. AM989]
QAQQLVPQVQQQSQTQATQHGVTGATGSLAKPNVLSPESMSKEELIQYYQRLQQALAGNVLPAKQVTMVKMQMQKLQAELAKPYRQEQAPRAIPTSSMLSSPGTIVAQAAAATAPVSVNSAAPSQTSQSVKQPSVAAELAPQIKELQQIQETKVTPVPPVEPLEFLTLTYKTLVGTDESGSFNDEVVTRESLFMLHNAFEGFVGKRVGNGPGKDLYDEGTRKRSKLVLKDEILADMLLRNEDGHPDAYMASYIDWGQEVKTV